MSDMYAITAIENVGRYLHAPLKTALTLKQERTLL